MQLTGLNRAWLRQPLVWLICVIGMQAVRATDNSGDSLGPNPTNASVAAPGTVGAPAAANDWPMLLGAQYTFIDQNQSAFRSPYSGPLSLNPRGDTEATNTVGIYTGWAPVNWGQVYLDVEKFDGDGVSNATGLAGVTNGDVVREGVSGIKKEFYIARLYARFMLPLGDAVESVDRGQDQIPGTEAATRLELKIGRLALPDDFDQNRYAGSTRTEFLNWSLWANTAWDYAANTRGYTNGVVVGYISPSWSLKYGVYLMPLQANQQELDYSVGLAHGQNLELRLSPWDTGTIVRLLGYLNTARMGLYQQALANAAATGSTPDINADARDGRHKSGFGINAEQPLADNGETGLFMRLGRDDGKAQTFAFTDVDQVGSLGAQLAGGHWYRSDDRFGVAVVSESLSEPHREYLAAGGCSFVLCDGRLNYAHEQILESYYRIGLNWPEQPALRWQLSPDFQYVRNPGYNRDRGPVHFWALRFHVEY
jgi:high affinity Mn2+ porin